MVSGRHVGAQLDGHQHDVSIQISINLNFGESTFFPFSDSGLYLLNGFDYYFDLFWMAWLWKPAIDANENRSLDGFFFEVTDRYT